MKNNTFKRLLKEKLAKDIPFIFMAHDFTIVYPLNDTGYMIQKHIRMTPRIYFDYFRNSMFEGVLYDSEFNAFYNTYIDE